jgi:hypothetical protein
MSKAASDDIKARTGSRFVDLPKDPDPKKDLS